MKNNYCYVDGSYNPKTKYYGCGGYLIDDSGHKHVIYYKQKDEASSMRNVAGELLGVVKFVELALKLGMRTLTIFYDYYGVEKWATGEWRTKNKHTKEYSHFIEKARRSGLSIEFVKVKSHSNVEGNDMADSLAKKAVEI